MKKKLFTLLFLALILTSGSFAYGVLSNTQTMGLEKQSDFAQVEVAEVPPGWNVFGSYIGSVGTGEIFVITPDEDYPGDLTCQVTLANASDLVSVYRLLILKIEIFDDEDNQMGTTEYLTLHKGTIDIEFEQSYSPYKVEIVGGAFITHRAGWEDGKEDPVLVCQILQR